MLSILASVKWRRIVRRREVSTESNIGCGGVLETGGGKTPLLIIPTKVTDRNRSLQKKKGGKGGNQVNRGKWHGTGSRLMHQGRVKNLQREENN